MIPTAKNLKGAAVVADVVAAEVIDQDEEDIEPLLGDQQESAK